MCCTMALSRGTGGQGDGEGLLPRQGRRVPSLQVGQSRPDRGRSRSAPDRLNRSPLGLQGPEAPGDVHGA